MKLSEAILNLYVSRNKPFSLIHFITNRCNARCQHCFIDFTDQDICKDELSLDEIRELTGKLGNALFNVNLTGGEPFLRKDIFEIAEAYFKNAGVKSVFISTNGMFTDRVKEFLDRFIDSGIKGTLVFSVSLDNFEGLHDQNRNSPGLFRNAIRTVSLIEKYNLPNIIGNVGITVADHNYGDVISLYRYLKKTGIGAITATVMREEGVIKKIRLKEKVAKAYFELADLIHSDRPRRDARRIKRNIRRALMNSKNVILDQIIRETYLTPKYISFCTAASLFGVIYANGEVYPCEIINRSLGSLRNFDMDFVKLWHAKAADECRGSIRDNHCNCVYGCAWSANIISNPRFLPRLIYNFIKQF